MAPDPPFTSGLYIKTSPQSSTVREPRALTFQLEACSHGDMWSQAEAPTNALQEDGALEHAALLHRPTGAWDCAYRAHHCRKSVEIKCKRFTYMTSILSL